MNPRAERERALTAEWAEVTAPHYERIRELRRLIAIEEEHIERKGRAVQMKRENIRFVVPSTPSTPSHDRP